MYIWYLWAAEYFPSIVVQRLSVSSNGSLSVSRYSLYVGQAALVMPTELSPSLPYKALTRLMMVFFWLGDLHQTVLHLWELKTMTKMTIATTSSQPWEDTTKRLSGTYEARWQLYPKLHQISKTDWRAIRLPRELLPRIQKLVSFNAVPRRCVLSEVTFYYYQRIRRHNVWVSQVRELLSMSQHSQRTVSTVIISVALVSPARCCGDTVLSICFMGLRISSRGALESK
jgi:hypothetical protein